MQPLTAIEQRGFMRRVYDLTTTLTATATTYATLLAAMQALSAANFSVTQTGSIIATAGNGKSITFGTAQTSGISPRDYALNAAVLRETYEEAKAALISAGDASPTDAEIFAEMLFRIGHGIVELEPSDMADLRCAGVTR